MRAHMDRIVEAHVAVAEDRARASDRPEAALAVAAYKVMAVLCNVQTPDRLCPSFTDHLTDAERVELRRVLLRALTDAARRLGCAPPNIDEYAVLVTSCAADKVRSQRIDGR
jgi:hypothetical protein